MLFHILLRWSFLIEFCRHVTQTNGSWWQSLVSLRVGKTTASASSMQTTQTILDREMGGAWDALLGSDAVSEEELEDDDLVSLLQGGKAVSALSIEKTWQLTYLHRRTDLLEKWDLGPLILTPLRLVWVALGLQTADLTPVRCPPYVRLSSQPLHLGC